MKIYLKPGFKVLFEDEVVYADGSKDPYFLMRPLSCNNILLLGFSPRPPTSTDI